MPAIDTDGQKPGCLRRGSRSIQLVSCGKNAARTIATRKDDDFEDDLCGMVTHPLQIGQMINLGGVGHADLSKQSGHDRPPDLAGCR